MKKSKIVVTLLISIIFASSTVHASTVVPFRTWDRDRMTIQDTTLEYMFVYGMELYNRGDYEQAAKVFGRILELDPKNTEVRKNLKKVDPDHPSLDIVVDLPEMPVVEEIKSTQTTSIRQKTTNLAKNVQKTIKPFNNNYDFSEKIEISSTSEDKNKVDALKKQELALQNQAKKLENSIEDLKGKLLNTDEIHAKRVNDLEKIIAKSEKEVERLNVELVKQDQMIATLKKIAAAHEANNKNVAKKEAADAAIVKQYQERVKAHEEYVKKQGESLAYYKKQYANAQKHIKQLREAITERDAQLAQVKTQHSANDYNVMALKRQLNQRTDDLGELKNQLVRKDAQLSALKAELAQAKIKPAPAPAPIKTIKASAEVGTPLVESIAFRQNSTTITQPEPVIEQVNTISLAQKNAIEIMGDQTISSNIAHYEAIFAQKDRTIASLKQRLAEISEQLSHYTTLPYDVQLTNSFLEKTVALEAIYPRDNYTQSEIASARLDLYEEKMKVHEKNQELSSLKTKLQSLKSKLAMVKHSVDAKDKSIDALEKDLNNITQ